MSGKFFKIMNNLQKLDNSPKKFGTDSLLTQSEIHLVEIIGNNPGSSVSDLARMLEITRGAVSQNLKKLESKNITYKEVDAANYSRSVVSLTSKGIVAYNAHKNWHARLDGGFISYLENLEDTEIDVIRSFLEKLDDFLRRRLESGE